MLTPLDIILWALALLVTAVTVAVAAIILYLVFRMIRPRKKNTDVKVYGSTPDGR